MIADPTRSENVLDQGLGRSIEVSAGVRDTLGLRPILVQTFFTPDQVDTDEAAFTHRTIASIAGLAAGVRAAAAAAGVLAVPPHHPLRTPVQLIPCA